MALSADDLDTLLEVEVSEICAALGITAVAETAKEGIGGVEVGMAEKTCPKLHVPCQFEGEVHVGTCFFPEAASPEG